MGQQLPSARAAMKRAAPALLGIVLGLLVIANARPTGEDSDTLDKSYVKFFNLEELIKKINIKRFREFQKSSEDTENTIPAIDLTQYAIATDSENPADNIIDDSPIIDDLNKQVAVEVQEETTTLSVAETTALALIENADVASKTEEVTDVLDGQSNKFFISEESVNAARKYGYKILLKKIGGKVVAVGKIKFEFPTLIEISPISDPDEKNELEKTTIAAEVQVTTKAIENNPAVTASTNATTAEIITTTEAIIPETTIAAKQDIETTEEQDAISTPSLVSTPPAEHYLAPAEVEAASEVISSVVPNENEESENPVIDTVMQLAQDAVDIIKDLEPGAEVLLSMCAV